MLLRPQRFGSGSAMYAPLMLAFAVAVSGAGAIGFVAGSASAALAQTSPAPSASAVALAGGAAAAASSAAAPAFTTPVIVVALLSLLLGFVTQAVNTGGLFGIATLPKAYLPYVSILGSFLSAVLVSLNGAPTFDGTAIFHAVIAGFTALTALGAGVTAKQHVDTGSPAARTAMAKMAAAKIGGTASLLVLVVALSGCDWWSSGGGAQSGGAALDLGLCVTTQVLSGNTSAPAIEKACGNAAEKDVLAILDSLWNFFSGALFDAGPPASSSSQICGVGPAPFKGAPACLTTSGFGLLRTAAGH